jgi:hypothetical protein
LGPPESDVLVEPADESLETASADASLTADAAMLLGIAATAMPFARSTGAQAERWLRILSRHGDAGGVLASLGIGDDRLEPFTEPADEHGQRLAQAFPGDPVATVTRCAQLVAHRLGASRIRPSDLLRAVITIYGSQFEHALMRRGVETKDVLERLGELPPGDR